MFWFRPLMHGLLGHPNVLCLHLSKIFPLSLYFYSILLFSQIFSATLFMIWCHTDQWLFDFRRFVWNLVVPESMQPADICPHLTPHTHHQGDEYLQVTYLVTSQRGLWRLGFILYSTADTMYDPVPNLRNCCKAGDDSHREEEMMAVEKDSEVE